MRITDLAGHWVLITGSSSGIGYAFAERFAALGASIVLVARRKNLLQQLATQLETKYKVQTKVIAADLTIDDEILRLKQELEDENIVIRALINNAGTGQWGHFEAQSFEKYNRMIRLNVLAPCYLCHLF